MTGPTPYWQDEEAGLALYLGDMREVLPALGLQADLIVADPPYAETSLEWDRWPDGWPTLAATAASSMWCFGSMRMFLDRAPEFAGWKLSQDVVWRKNAGSSFTADRFKRVHEFALHWYRGDWAGVHHEAVREPHYGRDEGLVRSVTSSGPAHTGKIDKAAWVDDGTRMVTSVIDPRRSCLTGHPAEPQTTAGRRCQTHPLPSQHTTNQEET